MNIKVETKSNIRQVKDLKPGMVIKSTDHENPWYWVYGGYRNGEYLCTVLSNNLNEVGFIKCLTQNDDYEVEVIGQLDFNKG